MAEVLSSQRLFITLSYCCYHASCNNQSEMSVTDTWRMEIPS